MTRGINFKMLVNVTSKSLNAGIYMHLFYGRTLARFHAATIKHKNKTFSLSSLAVKNLRTSLDVEKHSFLYYSGLPMATGIDLCTAAILFLSPGYPIVLIKIYLLFSCDPAALSQ